MMHLCLTPALLALFATAALAADAPAPAQESSRTMLSNPLAAQDIERLSAIVDRPLFTPIRRGASTPPAYRDPEPRTAPPRPPPNLIFSGVVMDGASARVVVLVGPEKKILRAQIGDEIDGWTVSGIAGRKLVLSLDGHVATFSLFNRDANQPILGDSTASTNAPQPLQEQQQNPPPADSNAKN